MKNGYIALDCACVAGGKLAAFWVETEEIFMWKDFIAAKNVYE